MVRLEFGREGGVVMLGQGDRVEVGAVRGRRNGLVRESAWLGVWWNGVCREKVIVSKLRMGL